ncbi:helix-turn-helix domain-containing protein [Tumebacillus flagellatus]|uniref:HTH cro/C1-type domain-containing protein n=1 Tax=Tumebacillus flagellatus TaxID=1157490 RepID=A0A074LWF2_9BACL|nr:helix-turn-helix transcriptional regulator [Tumebacillus flagellatus]KEO84408.1 hypothetical protein EL26_04715 [Tumebacillus flagellatus]
MTLGARLRALRQQAGLSQRELADGLVHKSMISQIESGRTQPSRGLLRQLAVRLGADPDQLLPALLDDHERLARYKRAQTFFSLHHYAEALPLLLDCLPASNPAWTPYDLHLQIAACYQGLNSYEAALTHLEAALTIAISEDRQDEVLALHVEIGETALAGELWSVAMHRLEYVYRELERRGHGLSPPEQEPKLCMAMARAAEGLEQLERAVSFWLEARERAAALSAVSSCRQVEWRRLEAEIAAGLGATYVRLDLFREADEQLAVAQALYEAGRFRLEALHVRMKRGVLLAEQSRSQEALSILEECRARAEREADPALHAEVLCGLAVVLLKAGRLTRACVCAEQAVQVLTGLERTGELVAAYQLLSAIQKQLGDYKGASVSLTRSQELFTQSMGWMKKSLRTFP